MRFFLDTEFIERGPKHPLELISIGIVAEDGREFYAVNEGFNRRHANDWVKANVLPHLPAWHPTPLPYGSPRFSQASLAWMPFDAIGPAILRFIDDDPAPEFWTYYGDYDWVIFCQLFGDMSQLPPHFPYFCHDLRQALNHEALSHISQPDDAPHDALEDARWIRETWQAYFARVPEGV